jgi:hypothetical protein
MGITIPNCLTVPELLFANPSPEFTQGIFAAYLHFFKELFPNSNLNLSLIVWDCKDTIFFFIFYTFLIFFSLFFSSPSLSMRKKTFHRSFSRF